MLRLWKFISNTANQQIISWLGGGIVVIAAGAWAVFVFFHHDEGRQAPASVTQSGTGIASGGNTTINGPVNIGLDEKKTGQQIAASEQRIKGELDKLASEIARQKGVEVAPLRVILAKLGEAGVGDDDIARRLGEKADELVRLRDEVARLRQGPAELASFAAQAQALLSKGDLDGARAALAAGRAAARNLREQSSRYEADFLAREAAVDHLQLAYRSAAAKYAEAAGLMAAVDRKVQWAFVLTQAEELYHQGDEFGDKDALAQAATVYRTALSLAPRAERPLDWAATQNDLGVALLALGAGETGTARLDEAAAAFREALQERTSARVPLDWAATENNLGNALSSLGERETGTARLEEAVTAYRAALQERTRERAPLDWAAAQNNLGTVLWTLGVREGDSARFEQAAAAYREALQERTRERAPLDWAMTQNNLGAALKALGERDGSSARLEEAVAAYRAALTERTRGRVPLQWAATENNLGNALRTLGEREHDTARLDAALTAHRAALSVAEPAGATFRVESFRRDLARTEAALAALRK